MHHKHILLTVVLSAGLASIVWSADEPPQPAATPAGKDKGEGMTRERFVSVSPHDVSPPIIELSRLPPRGARFATR